MSARCSSGVWACETARIHGNWDLINYRVVRVRHYGIHDRENQSIKMGTIEERGGVKWQRTRRKHWMISICHVLIIEGMLLPPISSPRMILLSNLQGPSDTEEWFQASNLSERRLWLRSTLHHITPSVALTMLIILSIYKRRTSRRGVGWNGDPSHTFKLKFFWANGWEPKSAPRAMVEMRSGDLRQRESEIRNLHGEG